MARRRAAAAPPAGEEAGFLAAIAEAPADATARVAYADWLDEHDRPYEALLQRDAAGVSEVFYKLRRKADGLFSEGRRERGGGTPVVWTVRGKTWRSLGELRPHIMNSSHRRTYGGTTPWDQLEVVVIELRLDPVAVLPVGAYPRTRFGYTRETLAITEPGDGPG